MSGNSVNSSPVHPQHTSLVLSRAYTQIIHQIYNLNVFSTNELINSMALIISTYILQISFTKSIYSYKLKEHFFNFEIYSVGDNLVLYVYKCKQLKGTYISRKTATVIPICTLYNLFTLGRRCYVICWWLHVLLLMMSVSEIGSYIKIATSGC